MNLLKNLSLAAPPPTSGEPTTPNALGSLSSSYTSNAASDYYDLKASPETQTRATFVGYDSPLADASPDAAQAAGELAKMQAQARRDATRREKFIECLSRDTVDIGGFTTCRDCTCIAELGAESTFEYSGAAETCMGRGPA